MQKIPNCRGVRLTLLTYMLAFQSAAAHRSWRTSSQNRSFAALSSFFFFATHDTFIKTWYKPYVTHGCLSHVVQVCGLSVLHMNPVPPTSLHLIRSAPLPFWAGRATNRGKNVSSVISNILVFLTVGWKKVLFYWVPQGSSTLFSMTSTPAVVGWCWQQATREERNKALGFLSTETGVCNKWWIIE